MKVAQLLLPIIFIVSGIVFGLIFEYIILAKLKKFAEKTRIKSDDVIISALRGLMLIIFVFSGIYLATLNLKIEPYYLSIILKTITILIIFICTVFVKRLTTGLISLYSKKTEGVLPTTTIFTNVTKVIVYILGFSIMLQYLGISISPILTALGVGGLAVALALQETLSSLFAGLHIVASKQIRIGNYVKLSTGEEGYVTDITWRNTTIQSLPNNVIIVPNSHLASSIVTNYDLPNKEIAVLVEVGVRYGSDLEKVEKITVEIAKEVLCHTPGGVSFFEPFIRYHTFGEFSINFTVILRGKTFVDQYLIKHEFIKKLYNRYKQEGIEIPVYSKGFIVNN